MASAPVCSTSNKEKGHALDTALDDWCADSGDYPDLVLYALRYWGSFATHCDTGPPLQGPRNRAGAA